MMDKKGKKTILDMVEFYLDNPDEEKFLTCCNMLRWQLPKRVGDTRSPFQKPQEPGAVEILIEVSRNA